MNWNQANRLCRITAHQLRRNARDGHFFVVATANAPPMEYDRDYNLVRDHSIPVVAVGTVNTNGGRQHTARAAYYDGLLYMTRNIAYLHCIFLGIQMRCYMRKHGITWKEPMMNLKSQSNCWEETDCAKRVERINTINQWLERECFKA